MISLVSALSLIFLAFEGSALKLNKPSAPKNCDPNTPPVEKLVYDGKDIKDFKTEVAIRGEDTRVLTDKPTLVTGCFDSSGKAKGEGSVNVLQNKKIITVLHNYLDKETCKPKYDLSKCFVMVGPKTPLKIKKWDRDLVAECEANKGKEGALNGDGIIVGELESDSGFQGYEIMCSKSINKGRIKNVTVIGAAATNSKLNPKMGSESIEGDGEVFSVQRSTGKIQYSNDTGKKTSGGAVTTVIDGKEYLLGVHRGDIFGEKMQERNENNENVDGFKADSKNNAGEGFIIDAERLGLKCKKIKEKTSQFETST